MSIRVSQHAVVYIHDATSTIRVSQHVVLYIPGEFIPPHDTSCPVPDDFGVPAATGVACDVPNDFETE